MRAMIAILGYETSRTFWRLVYPASRTPDAPDAIVPSENYAYNAKDIKAIRPTWLTQELLDLEDGRMHLLAFDADKRRTTKSHETSVWSGSVPDGSFYDLGTGVFVCSPAFLFLQTAASHNLVQTIAYGDELCGKYSFDPFKKRGMEQRKPLATINGLRAYIDNARSCPGSNRARQALDFMIENSASPAETIDELLMCLPYRYGGYCLPRPTLNVEMHLGAAASRIARKSVVYPDMYWESINLDVEHHGKYDHSGEKSNSDRARVNALREEGLEVIELTADQVGNLLAFETIVLRIARMMKKQLDQSKLGTVPERLALRRDLFSWSRNGGRKDRPLWIPQW